MKAVVFHGVGDIRLDDVPEPRIEQPTDAIVRLTSSAICGTDLHVVRGTVTGMRPGTVLGHEGVGIVEDLGDDVRNFDIGDRVVVCSTIACGTCVYCRSGCYAQCDRANPNGPQAGTAFFGGPEKTGPFHGLQAEYARIPFAHVGMVKLDEEISDDQAIMLSDIFPTGWFGAEMARIRDGRSVAVFGLGPVGQFAIASAKLMGAGRIFGVDAVASRLEVAKAQGAEIIDFSEEDPVDTLRRLTGGIGVDRAIDAVGVDAVRGPVGGGDGEAERYAEELQDVAPEQNPQEPHWRPGDAPSQALTWAVEALAKEGTLSVIGVYPETSRRFPVGKAMMKNLRFAGGNCHHRKYVPMLLDKVLTGEIDPTRVLTKLEPLASAIDAYRAFDTRQPHWMKVELQPGQ